MKKGDILVCVRPREYFTLGKEYKVREGQDELFIDDDDGDLSPTAISSNNFKQVENLSTSERKLYEIQKLVTEYNKLDVEFELEVVDKDETVTYWEASS